MYKNEREKALLEVLRRGLELYGDRQTEAQHGDRSAYLGMSDLARYPDCPRAAVAGKLGEVDTSLERLLTLQRGHWFEDGIAGSLTAAGLRFMRQVEISHPYAGVPIRAHLDMALVWEKAKPAVRVLEIKSMGTLPKEPYGTHERQVEGQVTLLEALWDAPRFTLKREDGTISHANLGFPELCRRELGVNLPADPEKVSIEGWLVCISMRDARAFGPWLPNPDALERLWHQAQEYWEGLCSVKDDPTTWADIPHARGFYPLCTRCQFNGDCPSFPRRLASRMGTGARQAGTSERAPYRLGWRNQGDRVVLNLAHKLSGTDDWVSSGEHRFRVSQTAGRGVLDRDALKAELAAIFRSEQMYDIDVDALLARHERAGAPSSRLTVNAINCQEEITGDRSEEALALTKKGVETLEKRFASPEIGEEARKCIRELLDHADKHAKDKESGQEAWYWDYLKWYTGDPVHFPEVDFIEKLMSALPDGDFRFIRIGEDYDDTEVRGGFWENPFDVELGRYISFSEAV